MAQVYDRLVNAGYEPTATTYTALISSYGKAGRLDEALGVFDKMVSTWTCLHSRGSCNCLQDPLT